MTRIEPPKLAAWMLENLIPAAERDEAVAGDLEEHLRAGRSDAWYWRQAATAVATGWAQYLGRRRAMLVFALLWSMLAPAWITVIDRAENSSSLFGELWKMDWPGSTLSTFFVWLILNVAFVWAGILVFVAFHAHYASRFNRNRVRQALLLVPAIFLPLYFTTFVITNLLAYPGLVVDRHTLSVLSELTDARKWAVIIRIPYLLTMVFALWRVVPRIRIGSAGMATADGGWAGAVPLNQAVFDQSTLQRFFAFVVAAGAINAMISGFVLCRLPESYAPSLSSLLLRAAFYVALGAAGGTAGAWLYWNNPASPFRDSAPVNFRLFALACAVGWIWIPALIILYEQITALTAIVAAVAAFALAAGLRRIPMDLAPEHPAFAFWRWEQPELFSDPLLHPQAEGSGMIIAVAIYAGGFAIVMHSFLVASGLLALAAFLLGWRRTVQRREPRSHEIARAVFRLGIIALPAIVITAWALLTGVAYRNRMAAEAAAQAASGESNAAGKAAAKSAARGVGGYESVILWPYPEKKQIVAPLLTQSSLLAPGSTRPLTIRFDGPYWYLQPPDQQPRADAHQAHGSPLAVGIEANNSLPLVMEARQRLSTPIALARCGSIEVDLENRDQHLGVVGVVLLLEDSSSPGHLQLDAGRLQLVTGEPETSGLQSFRFRLPLRGSIRRFDSIAVMLLPESGHGHVAPRIAVRELQLYPR